MIHHEMQEVSGCRFSHRRTARSCSSGRCARQTNPCSVAALLWPGRYLEDTLNAANPSISSASWLSPSPHHVEHAYRLTTDTLLSRLLDIRDCSIVEDFISMACAPVRVSPVTATEGPRGLKRRSLTHTSCLSDQSVQCDSADTQSASELLNARVRGPDVLSRFGGDRDSEQPARPPQVRFAPLTTSQTSSGSVVKTLERFCAECQKHQTGGQGHAHSRS